MDFERDGLDWPNRAASRFVTAAGLTWHVQVMGEGPELLLVHGTGASTHSWRHLIPHLATRFTIIAPDLPGHAFTQPPVAREGFTLPGMARALSDLMREMGAKPVGAIGHSAGAAILIRAALDLTLAPSTLISLNGALFPFGGWAGQLFSPLAKLMVTVPWVPRFMSWRALDRSAVARLLRDMGSTPSDEDIGLYARLFQDQSHVASTLAMMANWDLNPLVRDLAHLAAPLTLVAGIEDRAVPPRDAERAARIAPNAKSILVPASGHLTHEEKPERVAAIVVAAMDMAMMAPSPAI